MRKLPTVGEHMDKFVPTLTKDMKILDAVDFLLSHRVTSAPVVDSRDRLIGILSEKDCLKLLTMDATEENLSGNVENFMSTTVTTCRPKMDIYFAAGIFLGRDFRRLPVVDDDGRLIGAITRFDILRVIKSHLRA